MVSPLKLWKHPQPRRLWPTLGGLSVLAHIGILGVSLPYFLDLMQAERNTSTAAAAIPIELVGTEADEVAPNKTAPNKAAPSKSSAELSEASTNSSAQDTPTPRNATFRRPNASEPNTSAAINNSASQTGPRHTPPDTENAEETSTSGKEGSSNRENIAGDRAQNPSQQPASKKTTQTENESENSQTNSDTSSDRENNSSSETSQSESPTLPTVPGEPTIPSPEEERTNNEGNEPQSALISILEFSEAPNQQDVGKEPPKPKEGTVSNSVLLDPATRDCPRLTFSQEQWVYRVRVSVNGSVEKATVWTDMVNREMNAEESAIACLIENAGFEFEPALFDGEPILDDNLLLTISIIEAPR